MSGPTARFDWMAGEEESFSAAVTRLIEAGAKELKGGRASLVIDEQRYSEATVLTP